MYKVADKNTNGIINIIRIISHNRYVSKHRFSIKPIKNGMTIKKTNAHITYVINLC